MKKRTGFYRQLFVLLILCAAALQSVTGQVPNGMKYQAIVRDTWGRLIEHKTVGIEIKFLQNTEDGPTVFIEHHQKTTNEYGLVHLVIGSENRHDFENIDWSKGPYFVEVNIDIDGGLDYVHYGTSELLSVPYALYALHSKSSDSSDTLYISDSISGGGFIANVVDDYNAVGDGSTNDTEAFWNAFSENTDIFIPYSDQTYLIYNLSIPEGKRMWFEQGARLEVLGTITGDDTEIIAGDYQLFTSSSQIAGTWKGGIAYDSWTGNNQQFPGIKAMITSADTTRWGTKIPVLDSAYSAAWDGSTNVATRNAIYDKIQSLDISGGSSFIANVVDDYAAIGDGVTDNAQAFANAFSENNDVFIPNADDNFVISNLSIPPGKRLWFENGAIVDVTGTFTGDSTEIIAGMCQLFTGTSTLSGTWKSGIAYDCWVGGNQPIPGIKAMITSADTTRWGTKIPVLDSAYSAAWDGSIEVPTRNAIYDKIQSLDISGGSSFIANVVDDYAATGNGTTDNAQAFASALSENNDVFIPNADDNYLISNLTIPPGKRLWFENGAIVDVAGTFVGDSTEIIAGMCQLFTGTSTLSGTWKSGIAYDCWVGGNQPIPGIKAMITSADTTRWGTKIPVLDSAYSAAWDGSTEVPTRNAIYDKIQSLDISGGSSFIANVVDDYAAIGDGTTDNAQAFASALSENNDVFIPNADDNYLISNLTIPPGKRLWFERGAIIDVTSNLVGDTTEIIAGDYRLFTNNSTLSGTWKGGIAYDSWVGGNQPIPGIKAMITSADTTRWGMKTTVFDSVFNLSWDGCTGIASRNAIYDKIHSLELSRGSSFIANVVDDYAAIGDGVTDNAQAFSNAFSENSDVFIPQSDANYLITSLTIPPGKRIWFERGAVIDVTQTLVGDTTEIIAGDYRLFTNSSPLTGTWKGGIAYDSWLGNNQQIPGMKAMITPADTTRWGTKIPVLDSAYSAAWDGSTEVATRNTIYDKIQSLDLSGGSAFIANVVDDYAAIGDGTTDNAQSFASAFSENNDVFVPHADSNYVISNLTIPPGKRIWFERGATLDITGNLFGDTTEIIAGDYQLFTNGSTLSGTWKGGIAYDSWVGGNQPIPGIKAMITSADTTRWGMKTTVFDSVFNLSWDGCTGIASRNAIYDKIHSLELSRGSSFIANVVDDYAAIGDGTTDNAQAFASALIENNDVFIPSADSNYIISSLNIPHGKRIWFERGAVIDVTGNLVGDTTEIIAGDYRLFTNNSTLSGTWKGGIAYDSWFGNNRQIPGMKAMITPADTARWAIDTYGTGSFIANVIDYGAVADGVTNNANAIEQALLENNDIFIPGGDSTYLIASLTIPKGKRLWFETNAKIDVTGVLTGDSTEIMAGDQELFTSTSTLQGTWKGGISYDSWSGRNSQIPGMIAMVSPSDTTRWGIDTYGSGSFIANVIDYGAEGDGTTDDSTAFANALSANNDIFIPSSNNAYQISYLTVPRGKKIWFETGAMLDVKNELIIEGEINAGQHQIFTLASASKIIAENAIYDKSYPEWFGAKGDGIDSDKTTNRKALQAAVNVFPKNVWLTGTKYIIDSTIIMPPKIHFSMAPFNSVLQPSNDMNVPVLYFYKGAYAVNDINIYIPSYMARGGSSNVYNSFAVVGEFEENTINPIYHRKPSYINGLNIETGLPGTVSDGPGLRYNGLKWDVKESSESGFSSADYFSYFYRLNFMGADTAVFLSGDSQDDGHVNSEFIIGLNTDKCLHAIVIDPWSRGNTITHANIQVDYRSPTQPWQNNTFIDISSFANTIDVHFDDIQVGMDSAIIFRQIEGLPENVYCSSNTIKTTDVMKNHTTYQGNFSPYHKMSNAVGNHPFLTYTTVEGIPMMQFVGPDGIQVGFNLKGKSKFEEVMSVSAITSNPILSTRMVTGANTTKRPIIDITADAGANNANDNFGPGISAKINGNGIGSDQTIGGLFFTRDGANNEGKFEVYNGTNGNELRYSIDKNGVHTMSDVLKLTPRSSAPGNPTEGMIYVNSSNHHMYCYLGGVWKQLD